MLAWTVPIGELFAYSATVRVIGVHQPLTRGASTGS